MSTSLNSETDSLSENTEKPPSTVGSAMICEERASSRMIPFPNSNKLEFNPQKLQATLNPKRLQVTRIFRRRFFPKATPGEWNDWHWQISHSIRTVEQLRRMLNLSVNEEKAVRENRLALPMRVTPYYMSLLDPNDASHPLRRTVIPTAGELLRTEGEADDPLGEEHQSPVPGIVHRYPDRVLFLLHGLCATYCRYCTRSRVVGHSDLYLSKKRLEKAIEYIRQTPQIRDVLISGGDPLVLSDEKLEWLLYSLRRIPHVEILRIGTKTPVVLPQRITRGLVRMLKRYHPLWMSIHFTHPDELTPETQLACQRLADAGIPLGSQTVLLAGVNDRVDTMKQLYHGLLKNRVKPYYLYQCDPIIGSSHFRTPVTKGLEIIRGLRGHTSGYAVPTYVIDGPGGAGKIPLLPESVVGREGDDLLLQNYQGRICRYPDAVQNPADPPLIA